LVADLLGLLIFTRSECDKSIEVQLLLEACHHVWGFITLHTLKAFLALLALNLQEFFLEVGYPSISVKHHFIRLHAVALVNISYGMLCSLR